MINIYKYITIAGLAVSSAQAAVTLVTYDFNAGLGATNAGAIVTGSDITDSTALGNFLVLNPEGAYDSDVLQVSDGTGSIDDAVAQNASFSLTLSGTENFTLDSLSFDLAAGGASFERGITVRSSLTGDTNLFTVNDIENVRTFIDGDITVDLSAFTQFDADIAAGDDIIFDFFVHTTSNGRTIELDNIVFDGVVSVPEPSSAMLLGLGATAFLLRRRK